ncbi:DUF3634 domain-containing protein [Vibrio qinghaiensis]|uniref:DUF3634 domain-containing protein n=1 Tax=Vibrio qinghaiensis TaxID=2025808 RepID=A0A223MXE0_9VIBR|nr:MULTISPECIES: DUF3634 family protein [Vibrio]ASU22231.1 DUF3634 domain-containing protein [Vibrio qinghaiensis]
MLYVILAAAVVIFWLVVVDRPALKVKFKDGVAVQVKGHFPPSFKHNVIEIAEKTGFSGELKVYQQRTGAKLVFSKEVPKKIQQRIRNVFPHQGFNTKEQRTNKLH